MFFQIYLILFRFLFFLAKEDRCSVFSQTGVFQHTGLSMYFSLYKYILCMCFYTYSQMIKHQSLYLIFLPQKCSTNSQQCFPLLSTSPSQLPKGHYSFSYSVKTIRLHSFLRSFCSILSPPLFAFVQHIL